MAEFDTTDPDTIREALGAAIVSIVPSYSARQDERFVWAKDQEIAAGSTFRLFDCRFGPEQEDTDNQFDGAWHGGGIVYACDVEIRISYPVSSPLAARFAGADGRDIAGVLAVLHTEIDGMFALSTDGKPGPVLDGPVIEDTSGRHVAVFATRVAFFVSDEVVRD